MSVDEWNLGCDGLSERARCCCVASACSLRSILFFTALLRLLRHTPGPNSTVASKGEEMWGVSVAFDCHNVFDSSLVAAAAPLSLFSRCSFPDTTSAGGSSTSLRSNCRVLNNHSQAWIVSLNCFCFTGVSLSPSPPLLPSLCFCSFLLLLLGVGFPVLFENIIFFLSPDVRCGCSRGGESALQSGPITVHGRDAVAAA